MSKPEQALETKLIHAGESRVHGSVAMPIFQSAMFEYGGETDYNALKYIRLNNMPNHQALHEKLAALENGQAALVTASGMAAITTSILCMLGEGGHLLAQNSLYGGTHDFLIKDLPAFNGQCDFVDANDPSSWRRLLRPNTRAIYTESMTNPALYVADHRAVVAFAKEHGLISMIDNTFATPINFRPIELGYDLSIHSCTKYLNGHSDLVAGAVIGRADLVTKITHLLNHLGGTLDPHACFLLHRGMKTLAVRMDYQNRSTAKIAVFLDEHPAVARVNYPGLESHPHHKRAAELFKGYAGVLSFELRGGMAAADRLIAHLRLPLHTFSLGGVETLIIQPSKTSHAGMSREDRERAGISDGMIRLSVGLEATDDLIDDFRQALANL